MSCTSVISVREAIANYRRQVDAVGLAYDWERELDTTDPRYLRWTQWIFLQLFKAGLAYEGITYTKREKVLEVGPITATKETKETIPLPPILGGAALVCGVVLLIATARH